ncbi:MAG: hypothetical protein V2I32_07465 [Desulforhopalus sp.]|nr:hypothetical protein [Desulforhopalus sp.]
MKKTVFNSSSCGRTNQAPATFGVADAANLNKNLLQNDLFAHSRRYAINFILGIATMPVVEFSHALILNENLRFAKGSSNRIIQNPPAWPEFYLGSAQ